MSPIIYSRKNTGTSGTSGGEKRTSRIMPKFSLRRHGSRGAGAMGGGGEGDRVRLVEGEGGEAWGEDEETTGQRDVMSEAEIQNVKFQLAGLKRKRDSALVSRMPHTCRHIPQDETMTSSLLSGRRKGHTDNSRRVRDGATTTPTCIDPICHHHGNGKGMRHPVTSHGAIGGVQGAVPEAAGSQTT